MMGVVYGEHHCLQMSLPGGTVTGRLSRLGSWCFCRLTAWSWVLDLALVGGEMGQTKLRAQQEAGPPLTSGFALKGPQRGGCCGPLLPPPSPAAPASPGGGGAHRLRPRLGPAGSGTSWHRAGLKCPTSRTVPTGRHRCRREAGRCLRRRNILELHWNILGGKSDTPFLLVFLTSAFRQPIICYL